MEIKCVVVTPEKVVLEKDAEFVALPLYDGEYGIAGISVNDGEWQKDNEAAFTMEEIRTFETDGTKIDVMLG